MIPVTRHDPEHRARFEATALPYLGKVLSVALRLSRHPEDARDLVQETYLRAYRTFDRFRPGTNGREAPAPADLDAAIRTALDAEDQRHAWRSRRAFLAAAAGAILALGGVAVWRLRRSREDLPAGVARDYRAYRADQLELEITSAIPAEVEGFFRQRGIPFRTRVFDLGMMNYRVRGGRVHRLSGRPSALFVYVGQAGKILVCQMYPGGLEELPPPDEVRFNRGFRFQVYRRDGITVVFWREGEVTCVLAGDFAPEEILGLAFEKAMV